MSRGLEYMFSTKTPSIRWKGEGGNCWRVLQNPAHNSVERKEKRREEKRRGEEKKEKRKKRK